MVFLINNINDAIKYTTKDVIINVINYITINNVIIDYINDIFADISTKQISTPKKQSMSFTIS